MPGLRDLLTRPSLVLFLWLFSSQAGMIVLSPILPDIAREFGISSATAGRLRSISGATGIAAAGEWPAPAQRAQVLAWAIVGLPAAWIAGMPIVGAVAAIDWRAAWLAVPMAGALATLVLVRLRSMDAAPGGPAKPSAPRGRRTRRTSRPLAVQMATWSCLQSPEPNP